MELMNYGAGRLGYCIPIDVDVDVDRKSAQTLSNRSHDVTDSSIAGMLIFVQSHLRQSQIDGSRVVVI